MVIKINLSVASHLSTVKVTIDGPTLPWVLDKEEFPESSEALMTIELCDAPSAEHIDGSAVKVAPDGLDVSRMTTSALSPTFSRMQINLSDSIVSVLNETFST